MGHQPKMWDLCDHQTVGHGPLRLTGYTRICPKPCPSVSFDVNLIEIPCFKINETVTYSDEIQPVESHKISEVES